MQKSFVKRHFRLAIPTVSVVVLVFAFHRLHFIHNDLFPPNNLSDKWAQSLLPDKLGLPGVLYHGFVECFVTSSRYYQILWTMPVELINSFIVLVLPIASHNLKNKAWLFVAWLMVQLFLLQSYNGAAFTFGLLFAYWLKSGAQFVGFFSHKAVRLVCWLLGLYFASYPYTGYQNSVFTSIYKTISFFEVYPNIISYLVGVVLLFLALYFSPRIRNMLSYRIFIFFGKISFMFYLVHFLLLFSFSPYLYQALLPFVPHQMNMLITGLLSFALISGVSYLLYKFVDRPVIELCNLYSKKFFGR